MPIPARFEITVRIDNLVEWKDPVDDRFQRTLFQIVITKSTAAFCRPGFPVVAQMLCPFIVRIVAIRARGGTVVD
jgi:hypothetical protein